MTGEQFVVKITRSDDQAKLDAAIHEYKIFQHIPQHENVVRAIEQFVNEQNSIVHTVMENAGE